MSENNQISDLNTEKDSYQKTKKAIKKWVSSSTDKYFVKAIKKNLHMNFKFLDNTCVEGRLKWFNKYNLGVIAVDEREYIFLKHSLKYIKTVSL